MPILITFLWGYKITRAGNWRLTKKRVQRLIEHSTSYQHLCCVDS